MSGQTKKENITMMYNEILLREVMKWQVPTANIKLILCILADHTGSSGTCYPSIDRITELGCMSRSSAIRAINWLVENGYIERHSGGKGKPSLYQFTILKEETMTNSSVTQTHKGNNVIKLDNYISPSGVTVTPNTKGYVVTGFDDFWQAYPRKVGKGHARLAYAKAIKKAPPEDIMAAVILFSAAMEGKEKQFIPHPTTWLNGERWEDDIEDVSPTSQTNTDRLKTILSWDDTPQIESKENK